MCVAVCSSPNSDGSSPGLDAVCSDIKPNTDTNTFFSKLRHPNTYYHQRQRYVCVCVRVCVREGVCVGVFVGVCVGVCVEVCV